MNRRRVGRIESRIRAGSGNVRFCELVALAEAYGFVRVRVRGSHRRFKRPGVAEGLNLQSVKGMAKPYQAAQVMKVIDENGLKMLGA